MRIRTGRFEELRSGETGYAKTIKVRARHDGVRQTRAVAPPTARIGNHRPRQARRRAECAQFPIHGGAALSVLELNRPEPMPQPFIQRTPDVRRLRQPEVGFPTHKIRPQALDDLRHAAPARTPASARAMSIESFVNVHADVIELNLVMACLLSFSAVPSCQTMMSSQKRRQGTALRRSLIPFLYHAIAHDAAAQVRANQPDDSASSMRFRRRSMKMS